MNRYAKAAIFGNVIALAGCGLVWATAGDLRLAAFPLFLLGYTIVATFWALLGLGVIFLPPDQFPGKDHNHDPGACDFACPRWPYHGRYCGCSRCTPGGA